MSSAEFVYIEEAAPTKIKITTSILNESDNEPRDIPVYIGAKS
jgi:hypothetical protein